MLFAIGQIVGIGIFIAVSCLPSVIYILAIKDWQCHPLPKTIMLASALWMVLLTLVLFFGLLSGTLQTATATIGLSIIWGVLALAWPLWRIKSIWADGHQRPNAMPQ